MDKKRRLMAFWQKFWFWQVFGALWSADINIMSYLSSSGCTEVTWRWCGGHSGWYSGKVSERMGANVGNDISSGKRERLMVLSHRFMYYGSFRDNGRDTTWWQHVDYVWWENCRFPGGYLSVVGGASNINVNHQMGKLGSDSWRQSELAEAYDTGTRRNINIL